jgi:DnaJ-class molecular chaperone
MPKLKNPKECGNLFARIEIELPANLTDQEEELFRKLKALRE